MRDAKENFFLDPVEEIVKIRRQHLKADRFEYTSSAEETYSRSRRAATWSFPLFLFPLKMMTNRGLSLPVSMSISGNSNLRNDLNCYLMTNRVLLVVSFSCCSEDWAQTRLQLFLSKSVVMIWQEISLADIILKRINGKTRLYGE